MNKPKLILIGYLNNGNMQSNMSKEILFDRLTEELKSEGRFLNLVETSGKIRTGKFSDGSRIYLMPYEYSVMGYRFTHVYVDKAVLTTFTGQDIFEKHLAKSLVREHSHYEVSEHPNDRMLLFGLDNNGISVNKYFTK